MYISDFFFFKKTSLKAYENIYNPNCANLLNLRLDRNHIIDHNDHVINTETQLKLPSTKYMRNDILNHIFFIKTVVLNLFL